MESLRSYFTGEGNTNINILESDSLNKSLH